MSATDVQVRFAAEFALFLVALAGVGFAFLRSDLLVLKPAARVASALGFASLAIAALLSESAIYVWPGCGEAYGLAYLEAQAAGLPVVAQTIAGVPEVVISGRTGLLTPQGDVAAYALAIRRLLDADEERTRLATQARQFVRDERSLDRAATTLDRILQRAIGGR